MLLNTGSLIGTMLVTSGLGFAYWFVADRLFPLSAVGLASAATSTMMLLSSICLLGLSTLLISEIPRNRGKEGTIISAALLLVGGVGTIVGIIFALLTPLISKNMAPIGASFTNIILFALGIGLTSMTIILDTCMIAVLRGSLQFWRNAIFAVLKLVLLFFASIFIAEKTGINIYATWAASNLLSMVPLVIYGVIKARKTGRSLRPQWSMLRRLGRSAIQHYILNLVYQTPAQILPVIATIMLSASANAWFYTASMIANFLFAVIGSLTTVLHATNAAQIHTLTQKSRMTVGLATAVSACAGLILFLGAHIILSFFGQSYADQASWSLRILALGAFPLIIKYHYLAIHRIKDEVSKAIIPISVGSVSELIMAVIFTHFFGLTGLSLGWVAGMYLEAAIMSPVVVRTLRGVDTQVEFISSTGELATEDIFGVGDLEERPTEISMKIMAIEATTDMIRSIVIMDAPTIKIQSSQLYGDEDMNTPTIRLNEGQIHKGLAEKRERVQKGTAIQPRQVVEFMNAPTIKMQSIKRLGSSKPIKKTHVERLDTAEFQKITAARRDQEEREQMKH
ncbi:lipopolysaccharide biosynthesis protein [Dictyobacter aurantiacus]|uniref:Polysaccharide biosynthesis protein C-terminal domain-containing protein n=1 Tax=Dictyobacter aurantiacus TaxID=1936993 RepID=A0A401Z7D8_9CHLR|nr:lipopolysaccharide biosynthesis protein [Dictyobacter aurantiacus]GCE02777.1 hypothetical protein KDAU_01060 [Dictyobacter aurantiacus]